MPVLTDASGRVLSIDILRYEYEPHEGMHRYDLNWLIVQLAIEHVNEPRQEFAKTLTTWGLRQLVHWLRTIAHGQPRPARWSDMEDGLAFTAEWQNGVLSVVAHVRRWFRMPERHRGRLVRSAMIEVTFSPSVDELCRFSYDLESALSAFPIREGCTTDIVSHDRAGTNSERPSRPPRA